jgi:hypothetical protein
LILVCTWRFTFIKILLRELFIDCTLECSRKPHDEHGKSMWISMILVV